jgi:hypothetical protein
VGRAVHHRHRGPRRVLSRQLDQLRERLAIRGRIGDDDVLEPLPGEEQRLREGEGQDPRKGRIELEDPPQDGDRAHGLRCHPDPLASGQREHQAGVAAQRVEIDEGEGRGGRV